MAFVTMPTDVKGKITLQSSMEKEETVIASKFGGGYKQIASDGTNFTKEIWQLEIAPLKGTILDSMRSFYSSVGVTKTFWWTPPGYTAAQKGRIVEKSYKESFISRTAKKVQITIEQSFEAEI